MYLAYRGMEAPEAYCLHVHTELMLDVADAVAGPKDGGRKRDHTP